jgi:hypothetical protein
MINSVIINLRPTGARLASGMRLRDQKSGKLKIQHSLIRGLRPLLSKLLSGDPGAEAIKSVIPGEIKPVRKGSGKSNELDIRISVPLQLPAMGWKAIALGAGSRQEVFISTSLDKCSLEAAFKQAGASRVLSRESVTLEQDQDNSALPVYDDVKPRHRTRS